jgi:glycolate oxidase FAD binding subunit
MNDLTEAFHTRILERKPLRIRGGGSKDFYGGPLLGEVLDTRQHTGILAYEPTELVVVARAGTSLAELESALAERRQFLAFEAPHFGPDATVGGAVATGLSGPRRMTAGAVRDFVLGVRLLDGLGRELKFGGEVMKNVAGYDLARLMTGSLGTLGLMLDVSLKVLPLPIAEASLQLEADQATALSLMNRWAGQPLPISATCWVDGRLTVRLSGAMAAVRSAQATLGGELLGEDDARRFWDDLKEQRNAFFAGPDTQAPLWRLAVPSTTPPLALPGTTLLEWNGAQRWLRAASLTDPQPSSVRECMTSVGGHGRLFRGACEAHRAVGVFRPLPPALLAIHKQLKQTFDPHGVFNPQRMYPDF